MTPEEGLDSASLVLPDSAELLDFQGDAGRDRSWNFLIQMPCRSIAEFVTKSQLGELQTARRVSKSMELVITEQGWDFPHYSVRVSDNYDSARGTRNVAVSRTAVHSADCLVVVTGGI